MANRGFPLTNTLDLRRIFHLASERTVYLVYEVVVLLVTYEHGIFDVSIIVRLIGLLKCCFDGVSIILPICKESYCTLVNGLSRALLKCMYQVWRYLPQPNRYEPQNLPATSQLAARFGVAPRARTAATVSIKVFMVERKLEIAWFVEIWRMGMVDKTVLVAIYS